MTNDFKNQEDLVARFGTPLRIAEALRFPVVVGWHLLVVLQLVAALVLVFLPDGGGRWPTSSGLA